ncbi:NADP-dependent oxidoreductase [Streptomyces caniscabiei]|uniref:NADP-dependent oxidoreductase n=1 Tax=Streptomyces caniscabiei TaxID=2746961 RepID=UPI0029B8E5F4|nr:NADP-dependent oxidoreductase [Streptomyces caniscabiei]MDX2776069.1 NADP-dependent oxidoreductase [Streptomyces caniscabiei]
MKAAQIKATGGIDVIQLVDTETPQPDAGHVLVEVYASSINPIETKVREGVFPVDHLPITLGGDVAGIVAAVGPGVSTLAVGDKVYGQASVLNGGSGAYAEFASASVNAVAKMPGNTPFTEAAALPLVGVSALQALITHINLQEGQKLFIHGGAGGIGSIAIQVARHMGAYVATTATGDGIDFVQGLGADEVIDYKTQDFQEILHDFDAVFDLVGGDDFFKALHVLRRGGIGVSMAGHVDDATMQNLGVTAISQFTQVTTEMLTQLARLVEEGVVTPQVDTVYPFAQIQEAFAARESGHVKGKVVLVVKAADA